MGQTPSFPKYAEDGEDGGDTSIDEDTIKAWKEELLKTGDIEQNDLRSSLIDVGRSLLAIDNSERKQKREKHMERIRVQISTAFNPTLSGCHSQHYWSL